MRLLRYADCSPLESSSSESSSASSSSLAAYENPLVTRHSRTNHAVNPHRHLCARCEDASTVRMH